jgi:peptidoglycan/xylan/chitin deacetylase (PgdA/CDA1 family)
MGEKTFRLRDLRIVIGVMLMAVAGCREEPVRTQKASPPVPPKAQASASVRPMIANLPARTLILTYHDVRESKEVWFDTTPKELEAQIVWLKRQGARFITLDQLHSQLTGALPASRTRQVVITFADNYRGFLERGVPILRKHDIPATMFVHTRYVGSPVGRPKMNWDELREIDADSLFEVESQTVSHPKDLRILDHATLKNEMTNSKAKLEKELRKTVRFIAYPNGKFDARTMLAAKQAGYLMGLTEEQTPAELSPSMFAVARYVHTQVRSGWQDLARN